ncbi:MAG: 16S rRNA (cytidine(1402)-2'-O)-methyltransferase [Coriobacteriia bacterium]|nr:16S rRNA (cytidine(1402)-2'-O)-methyltransferase [Coriobacteriia bacterium]
MISICSTPIGNLDDVSKRLLDTLKAADVIYAEDTRVTSKLLSKFNIKTQVRRMDENTIEKQANKIVKQNKNIAYCTDAGTPGVSDPGLKLVREARINNIDIEVIPGPCAAITAYVASGFTSQQFFFGGFFPRKESDRIKALNKDCLQIYYESPKRISSALSTIAKVLPERKIAVCRELTKIHEDVQIGLANQIKPIEKGEIVIVIDKPSKEELKENYNKKIELCRDLDLSKLSTKDATKLLQLCGISKNDAYKLTI